MHREIQLYREAVPDESFATGEIKIRTLNSIMEVTGNLVVPAVFKTDVADSVGQAGSIPVRLRDPCSARQASAVCWSSTCRGTYPPADPVIPPT